MAIIDDRTRELSCKVLFVGPPAAGIGTTFRELWTLIPDAAESAVIPRPGDSPIYELCHRPRPAVRKQGLTLVLHLVGYEDSPRSSEFMDLLQDADGLVLVMDSAPTAMAPNLRTIQEVSDSLGTHGRSFEQIAILLQYNKRDLQEAVSIRQLEDHLNTHRWPYVATSSHRAQGLQDMLERLTALISRWVRVPAQSEQPAPPPPPPPRPPDQRPSKATAPTSSMVDAFARAEQKIFGRQQPVPGLADESDEDRTVVAGSSDPSAPAPSMGPAPVEPLARPLQTDWSDDGPTQLDTSHAHAQILGVSPTRGDAGGPVSWDASSPVPAPGGAPAQVASPQPQALPPQPEEDPVAPWEDGPPGSTPAPAAPQVPDGPGPAPAARPAEGPRVVHVLVPELTGHTIERVGVAELRDMVTVAVPLSTSVGRDERSVELRLEMGGAPPPTKAPAAPARGGSNKVVSPLFVICVGLLAALSTVLLVLYLMK